MSIESYKDAHKVSANKVVIPRYMRRGIRISYIHFKAIIVRASENKR